MSSIAQRMPSRPTPEPFTPPYGMLSTRKLGTSPTPRRRPRARPTRDACAGGVGEDARLQAVLAVVDALEHRVEVGELLEHRHRAERLLGAQSARRPARPRARSPRASRPSASPPREDASRRACTAWAIQPSSRTAAASSIIGPMNVSSSSGSPARSSRVRATNRSRSGVVELLVHEDALHRRCSSAPTGRTRRRRGARRRSRASRPGPRRRCTAALPPSSSTTFFLPARAFRSQPTSGEPVKESSLSRSSVGEQIRAVAMRGQDDGERALGQVGLGEHLADDQRADRRAARRASARTGSPPRSPARPCAPRGSAGN